MPMLDAFIPEGALAPNAEESLLSQLTDLLLKHEGVDPANERARSIAWVFLHRPKVFVAGSPAASPCYRFIASVPEGQYNDERRKAVTKEMTEAVAKAENCPFEEVNNRVWVFTNEVPDGTWGGGGQVFRLPDIAAFVLGEEARQIAEGWLADRRRERAAAILGAAGEHAGR